MQWNGSQKHLNNGPSTLRALAGMYFIVSHLVLYIEKWALMLRSWQLLMVRENLVIGKSVRNNVAQFPPSNK